jgi:putative colanic acid biosynthesis acetyltransferase WcaF
MSTVPDREATPLTRKVDVETNRAAKRYSTEENVRRTLWALATPLFRFSPRPFFGWRRFLLRLFGARVGPHANVYASATIAMPWNLDVGGWASVGEQVHIYNLGPVTIGPRATLSLGARVCAGTHDHRRASMPLLKPPVRIEADAWICAWALVGPDVTIGEGAVVGAGAVAMRSVPPWTVVAGNPAQEVGPRAIDAE